jgi:hypothetical protein
MSTKLNAKELAAKRFQIGPATRNYWTLEDAYEAAIREHSQTIADERDELREALEAIADIHISESADGVECKCIARTVLAKYAK